MNTLRRIVSAMISFCIILGIITTIYATSVSVDGTEPIYISFGDSPKKYSALITKDDLFLSAKTYGEITKYQFIDGKAKYGYKLGRKHVSIDKTTGELNIDLFNIKSNAEIISFEGEDYISASCLLPWLNISCVVSDDGSIDIIPDGASLWEVIYDLDYDTYMFNISTDIGTSAVDTGGLISAVVFDTVINIRWDRLIPSLKKGSNWYETAYDYKCYVTALMDMATDDSFFGKVKNTADSITKASKSIGDIEDSFNCDLFQNLDTDDEAVQMFMELVEDWKQLREFSEAYGKVAKYVDLLSAFKTYEIFLGTSVEYRKHIAWLAQYDTGNSLLNAAAQEVDLQLADRKGCLYTLAVEFGRNMFKELPEKWVEGALKNASAEMLQDLSKSLSKGFFHSLSTYMLGAKAVFKLVFPVTDGISDISKLGVLEAIQDDSYDIASDLVHERMSKENIMHIRQSMLMALNASKMCYSGLKKTTDAKLLHLIDVFGANGAFDIIIEDIDNKIGELIASEDYTENDSIEGKVEQTEQLRNNFSVLWSIVEKGGTIGKKLEVSKIESNIYSKEVSDGYADWLEITALTSDGTVVWSHTTEENLILSSQAEGMNYAFVFNSDQVVFSSNGYLYSLDKQTGEQLWAVSVGGERGSISSSFKEYNNCLYYYNYYGHFFVISNSGDVIIDSENETIPLLSYLSLFCFLEIEDGGIIQLSYEIADPSYQYNEYARDCILEQQYDWGSTYTIRYDPINKICLPWTQRTGSQDVNNEIDKRMILIYSSWNSLDEIATLSGEDIDPFFFFGSLLKYGTDVEFYENGTFEFNIALRYFTGTWNVEDDEIIINCTPIPDDPSYIDSGSTITAVQLREQTSGDYVLVLTLDDEFYLTFSQLGMCFD